MIRSPRTRRLTLGLLVLACALLVAAGCSSVSGGRKRSAPPPIGPSLLTADRSVGTVTADLDEVGLTPEVVEAARQFAVAERLQSRVTLETKPQSGGTLEVRIHVIGMRLRSTGTASAWGFLAGTDWLNVEVVVAEDGRQLKRFEARVSNSLGGVVYGGREVRVDRMVNALARRIAAGI